jgi:hypothetical protein
MYDYDRRASAERPKYPDGRLMPQEGDVVYQMVPGAFGMAAVIEGAVIKGRGGLRVKVTGGGGAFGIGHAPTGRTFQLTPQWTVKNDPAIKARQEAKERERLEKETREQAIKEEAERAIEAEAKRLGVRRITGIHDVKPGDEVYDIASEGAYYGRGDPHKITVEKHVVTDLLKDVFVYIDNDGHEVTSGLPTLWWKR